jgi:hypothetical protein
MKLPNYITALNEKAPNIPVINQTNNLMDILP